MGIRLVHMTQSTLARCPKSVPIRVTSSSLLAGKVVSYGSSAPPYDQAREEPSQLDMAALTRYIPYGNRLRNTGVSNVSVGRISPGRTQR